LEEEEEEEDADDELSGFPVLLTESSHCVESVTPDPRCTVFNTHTMGSSLGPSLNNTSHDSAV